MIMESKTVEEKSCLKFQILKVHEQKENREEDILISLKGLLGV